VGINEPPQEMFGKLMSISDELMYRYYELLTDVPTDQIETWKREAREGKVNPRDLKAQLARMIVADFWGEEEARKASAEFDRIFKHKEIPEEMEEKIMKVSQETPRVELVETMFNLGLVPSRGEAKRLIRQGGVYLDGQRVESIDYQLDASKPEQILKIGKRKFYKIKFVLQ